MSKLRVIFAIIEQQRVSRDRVENLGAPDPERAAAMARADAEAKAMQQKPTVTMVDEQGRPMDGRPKRTLTIVDESGNPIPGNKMP